MEDVIERTAVELRAEADVDFISLPLIAESLREDLGLQSEQDIRRHTLDVIERLMARGVYPGDHDDATILSFWPGKPSEHLRRIETEWIAMGKTPTLAESICWLGLRSKDLA